MWHIWHQMLIKTVPLFRTGTVHKVFKNNMPGIDWLCGFIKRNLLTQRISNNVKAVQAEVNGDIINNYFNELELSLDGIPATHIFDEKYNTFCWNNQPKSWKVSVWERETRIHLLACLLASCQLRNFLCEFTEQCFAVLTNQAMQIILCGVGHSYFSWIFPLSFFLWYYFKIQVKSRGGGIF